MSENEWYFVAGLAYGLLIGLCSMGVGICIIMQKRFQYASWWADRANHWFTALIEAGTIDDRKERMERVMRAVDEAKDA